MRISDAGIDLIRRMEGLRLKAYQDSNKVWTIGFGSTTWPWGDPVKEGDTIENEEEAVALMMHKINEFERDLGNLVKVPLAQYQIDSLLSFMYNFGTTKFADSTLLKKINSMAPDVEVEAEFKRWIYVAGKLSSHQVKRRGIEADMYFNRVKK